MPNPNLGSLVVKCATSPQIATFRTSNESKELDIFIDFHGDKGSTNPIDERSIERHLEGFFIQHQNFNTRTILHLSWTKCLVEINLVDMSDQ